MKTILLLAVVLLIRTIRYELPCPGRAIQDDIIRVACGAFHYHERLDSSVVSLEYIREHYEHPEFNLDSTICHVTEEGFR
jgi:hypothetical protein